MKSALPRYADCKRITTIQIFLSDTTTKDHELRAYSSWKLNEKPSHRHHGGIIKSTERIETITIAIDFTPSVSPPIRGRGLKQTIPRS